MKQINTISTRPASRTYMYLNLISRHAVKTINEAFKTVYGKVLKSNLPMKLKHCCLYYTQQS